MTDMELTRAEKLRLAGVKKHGSEEAWRKFLSDAAKRNKHQTPGGFAFLKKNNPKLHKQLSAKGGKAHRPNETNATQENRV